MGKDLETFYREDESSSQKNNGGFITTQLFTFKTEEEIITVV